MQAEIHATNTGKEVYLSRFCSNQNYGQLLSISPKYYFYHEENHARTELFTES